MDGESPITRFILHKKIIEFSNNSVEERKTMVIDFLIQHFGIEENDAAKKDLIDVIRKTFFPQYYQRWNKLKSNVVTFEERNEDWLNKEIDFPETVNRPTPEIFTPGPSTSSGKGRKSISFEDSCERGKRRKTQDLRKGKSSEELVFATCMKLKSEGEVDASKLLKESLSTPTRASKYLKAYRKNYSPCTVSEALSMVISSNLTKSQYIAIRRLAADRGLKFFPPYYKLTEEKKAFYPESINISENVCEVSLQSILNKTCQSIVRCVGNESNEIRPLILICKWGFDGSSGYTSFKYKREEETLHSEEKLFATSFVPLRLECQNTSEVIWKNPRPSSKMFCRSIRLRWVKETDETTRDEEAAIQKEIENLEPFETVLGPVTFRLALTMMNGKACGAITKTSSMTCHICEAKISKMNDIDFVTNLPENKNVLKYGLSTLHAYIRFFECLLHVAYRLEIQVWKVTKDKSAQFEARKKKIQLEFRSKMGILVDAVKQGHGSTNDGNTARRFFSNPSLSAEITGIDEKLIKSFSIILRILNSQYSINTNLFKEYCLDVAKQFVKLYSWYYMPTSVHTILIHGASVIGDALLPIGQLSEEAQEAKNKDIRKFREGFTTKTNLLRVNDDLFKRLLLSSDPFLSTLSIQAKRKKKIDDDLRPFIYVEGENEGSDEDTDEEVDEIDEDFNSDR